MARGNTISGPLLTIFTQNVDRPIPLEELVDLSGLNRGQCSNGVTNLINTGKYPNIERVQNGVYRWNSKPVPAEAAAAPQPTEMLILVLTCKEDGSMLVRDTDGGAVYVMRPLDF